MKALVYTGPENLVFRNADNPTRGVGEVIVKVESVGICGSDMHAFLGHDERRFAPLILGHEVAGVVVDGPNIGHRVTLNPLVTCGSCAACTSGHENLCPDRQIISMPPREGGFAQYVAIPEANLVRVPDGFPLEKASLVEPVACGWHAVRLAQSALDKDMPDVRALVIGGGAIGVGAGLSMMAFGVKDVTILEPNEIRHQYLSQTTQMHVVNLKDLINGAEFDLVIDAVGIIATRKMASKIARPGAVIMHIGLGAAEGGLDIRRMTLQEITFIGTYTYTAEDFRVTAHAIFDGRLGALDWIEKRPLSSGQRAFEEIHAGKMAAPKTVLIPEHRE